LSPGDIAVLVIVALILFFGASKLPELFRSMGRAVGEFKKGRMEAELELQQMQQASQQGQQAPNPQVSTQPSREAELEQKIRELQAELERLKAQKSQ